MTTQYVGFEIELCQQRHDRHLGDYVETVQGWEAMTEDEITCLDGGPVFWTVYGRTPEGEADAIADRLNLEAQVVKVRTEAEEAQHMQACAAEALSRKLSSVTMSMTICRIARSERESVVNRSISASSS